MKKRNILMALVATLSLSSHAQDKERPTAYMVSDAHLDTQWNWDIQTTLSHHIRTTLEQNLMLMRQYPNYIFNFEGATKYHWMKEYYSEHWDELKARIAEGRWHICGTGWDANEVIICSPESWIRNVALGQNYYRQEFGKESTDIFLPDCFGFPYYLPTAAAHCGLIGFSSQKLGWRTNPFYEGNKRYPFTVGLWQGIDGSRIMMTHGFGYGERWKDEDLSKNEQVKREVEESPLGIVYRYYGTGDIGGSPTIESVRAVEKGIKGDGPVRIVSATSDEVYKKYLPYEKHPELPVFDGELTMDVHGNGCYTSQAAMKLYNRQNEHLGDAAERAAVAADWAGEQTYPIDEMTNNWRRVIWHQFHDDITGTSIPRAYEFSWNDELITLQRFSDVLTTSVASIARKLDTRASGTPIILYNAETFPVESEAKVEIGAGKDYTVYDEKGKVVPSQVVIDGKGKAQLIFCAKLPSTGYAVYSYKQKGQLKSARLNATQRTMENSVYRLTINDKGDITSLYDKQNQRELVANGKALRLVVFDHCDSQTWPAWEILKPTLDRDPLPVHEQVSVQYIEKGAMRQTICVTKRYGESEIRQYISLNEGALANRVDIRNEVEWRSLNALLKAEFPLSVKNEKASYDIGLGYVQRGNNQDNSFEVYSHEWTDLTDKDGSYGVTLLNDSRYGWDKPNDNTLRLSLLYSPKCDKSGYRYQDRQDFGYHTFTYSIIGHKGALQPSEAVRQSTVLNSPVKTFTTTPHKGELGSSFSFVQSDNDKVIVRTLKRAEVSDEYVIRLHETEGKATQKANVKFAGKIVKAVIADGTEKELSAARFHDNVLEVEVKPFSLATYKVVLQREEGTKAPEQQPMELAFNRKCSSYNEFRSSADFVNGYTYAAELLPADHTIQADGITFRLGEYDAANGLSCKGDTLQLPTGYQHLYLLAASDKDDRTSTFRIGQSEQSCYVPYYTGFVGQWGHDGQTKGYLKDAKIGYLGTHRHSPEGDGYYEYTYMFRLRLDIPKGATSIVLPNDPHVVIFAATLSNDDASTQPAAKLFETSNRGNELPEPESMMVASKNLMKDAKVIGCSGHVNRNERPELLIDGKEDTKWCDTHALPNHIDFDLGGEHNVARWTLLSAGAENQSYITRACLLMGRQNENEEWRVLDLLDSNKKNIVNRTFPAQPVRYIRILVTAPEQPADGKATRLYEFGLYGEEVK